jgi:ArsR family transcriptional regulator
LKAILDGRQARAEELLGELGIVPLDEAAGSAVGETIKSLLGGSRTTESGEVRPLGRLLDIGTGTGTMLSLLAPSADRVVAIDESREMRLVARARVLANGLVNCTVQAGDMYALSLADASFDTVTMDRVLGVASRPEVALIEARRVLRPGGRLLVVEAAQSGAERERLRNWLGDAGFDALEARECTPGAAEVYLGRRAAAPRAHVA